MRPSSRAGSLRREQTGGLRLSEDLIDSLRAEASAVCDRTSRDGLAAEITKLHDEWFARTVDRVTDVAMANIS